MHVPCFLCATGVLERCSKSPTERATNECGNSSKRVRQRDTSGCRPALRSGSGTSYLWNVDRSLSSMCPRCHLSVLCPCLSVSVCVRSSVHVDCNQNQRDERAPTKKERQRSIYSATKSSKGVSSSAFECRFNPIDVRDGGREGREAFLYILGLAGYEAVMRETALACERDPPRQYGCWSRHRDAAALYRAPRHGRCLAARLRPARCWREYCPGRFWCFCRTGETCTIAARSLSWSSQCACTSIHNPTLRSFSPQSCAFCSTIRMAAAWISPTSAACVTTVCIARSCAGAHRASGHSRALRFACLSTSTIRTRTGDTRSITRPWMRRRRRTPYPAYSRTCPPRSTSSF